MEEFATKEEVNVEREKIKKATKYVKLHSFLKTLIFISNLIIITMVFKWISLLKEDIRVIKIQNNRLYDIHLDFVDTMERLDSLSNSL